MTDKKDVSQLTSEDMMNIRDGHVMGDDPNHDLDEENEVLEVHAAPQSEVMMQRPPDPEELVPPEDAIGQFGGDKLIIVTGGAGFIGTHLIKNLNERGQENIILVDDLSDPRKIHNIKHLKFQDYIDKSKFIELFSFMVQNKMVECLYHLGAESATTCTDGKYLMENNYQYTCNLMDICAMNNVPMVYASSAAVYGDIDKEWTEFDDKSDDYTPNNYYALSKLQADRYQRKFDALDKAKIVGLRYFNVTSDGEHEQHKDGMKSAPCWMKEQYAKSGKVTLFIGSDQFKRDFIPVQAAVYCTINAMSQARSGVYNIGMGEARSFLELALEVVDGDEGAIRYIPMPEELALHYQTYTCANMDNAGFSIPSRP